MNITHYIGLDVHKDSIAISYAEEGDRKDAIYHGSCGDSNPAAEGALRKLAKKLGVGFKDLKVCYEAGPTNPLSPPSGPARRLVQGPPSKSKFLAAGRTPQRVRMVFTWGIYEWQIK